MDLECTAKERSADRGEGNSDAEGGEERSLCEGPRAPGVVPRMGLARGNSAMVSRNHDGLLRVRGRCAPAGVLRDDDGAVGHRLTAVVGAGQGGRRTPMFVVALRSGCRGRIAPGFAQHAGIRPSHQCQDDRQDSRAKHGTLVDPAARPAPAVHEVDALIYWGSGGWKAPGARMCGIPPTGCRKSRSWCGRPSALRRCWCLAA